MKKIISIFAALMAVTAVCAGDLTCVEAHDQALGENPPKDSVDVVGYITEASGPWSKGQQTFWLADSKDGGKVFQAYWANLPEPYKTNEQKLPLETKLRIRGILSSYKGNAQFKNGRIIDLLEVPVVVVDTIPVHVDQAIAEALVWEVGKTSEDVYAVSGVVKNITKDFAESQYTATGFAGRESFTLVTHTQDTVEFIAYDCNVPDTIFKNDSVTVLGNLQHFEAKKIEISGGKVTLIQRGEHQQAKEITLSKDEAIETATAQAAGWLSEDIYIVQGVSVDSISYAYNETKGTQSFYSFGAKANFIAYSCKVPQELFKGDIVSVKGKLQNYKGDAEIKSGEIINIAMAIDDIHTDKNAVKRIEGSQMVIIKNGKKYNILGTIMR